MKDKILDAQAFHQGIERLLSSLDTYERQLQHIEKSIKAFTSLDESFKGSGGQAIRSFYQEFHLPFLSFLGDTIGRYKAKLKVMNYALSTVESSQSGFIRQSFLDNELEHGLRKVENLTKDLTDEVNHALRRISDIMSVPTIRDDEFIYKVRQAMKHKDNTIERLQQFDQRQTYTLHTIDQDFTKLKNCVHDIQAMFKSKQIKITTFKANQLSDIEPYRDIRARLEYEEAVHLIKEKLIDLYHKAIDTNYAELLLEAFHEVFPGFSSKAKVSSTIEKNDLSHLPKDVADKYKDSPELTEEQTKNLQNYLKGIQSGEIEGNMDEDFHVNSDDYALEHNIFGRPLGGGKPEIDDKLVAGAEFVFDFFIGDDVNTVLDSEASLQDRILAGISIVPAGKVLKLARKIKNVDKVVDGGKDVKGVNKGKGNDIAKEPFVPDEYWRKKAPQNATPGSKIDHYRDYNGKTEKSTVIYDNFGRQKYRIDHSDHSMPKDHSVPHLHEYKYGPGYHPEKGMEFRYNFWRIK
ncbi:LXG domain-containing protein [Metabacillus niabensis]|nr:LXG domain-containing protein [Metabacillus niabensis]